MSYITRVEETEDGYFIVIPNEIATQMNIKEGDEMEVRLHEDCIVVSKVKPE